MNIHLYKTIYIVLCVVMLAFLGVQWTQHPPIQTQLTALLPQETATNPIIQAAEKAQENELNQFIILLIGAQDSEQAFQAASQVAQTWQQSGLFRQIDSKIEPNIHELQQSVQRLGAATLPERQIQQLYHQPKQYFTERAEAAVNPFSATLLPLDADWLGFSRFMFHQQGQLNWHSEHAMLYTEYDGKTWVWLRAHLADAAPNPALLTLWRNSKMMAQQHHYQLLATGGSLFATDAKQAAEHESTWMSAVGLTLTFVLLWVVFRSRWVWALVLPLGFGVLWGLAATILIFGEIHALTLVVGTSLVGVLVDFPLHWLAASLFRQPERAWQSESAMRRVLPSFLISLTITAFGYLLLWFTPLPILRQTAIFSVAALLGAFATTVWCLPPIFRHYEGKETAFSRLMVKLTDRLLGIKWHYVVIMVLMLALSGIWRVQWRDDIRHWMVLRADFVADSRQIANISGMGVGQTVLLTASSPDELLKRNRELTNKLSSVAKVQSLNQWILPTDEQRLLNQQFAKMARLPDVYAPLVAIGVPEQAIQAALNAAAQHQIMDLETSLHEPQAEVFRSLYLGRVNGQYAALARLYDVRDDAAVQAALPNGARLLDKRASLNQQFIHTRNQAAWLKVLSFVLAWLVLWRLFGWRRGGVILAVPVVAVLGTLGLLGWLGIPVNLFALFGLLLAAAIGVDYAVYAVTAPETASARITGITLAALTTGISFILLAWSVTPAVAAFGVSVSCGVGLNWVLAVVLARYYSGSLKEKVD